MSSPAYPSGHATLSIATWGVIAIVLAAGRSGRVRSLILAGATALILLVGASCIYLGVHWLTDVIGGYGLGGAWLALIPTQDTAHGGDRLIRGVEEISGSIQT